MKLRKYDITVIIDGKKETYKCTGQNGKEAMKDIVKSLKETRPKSKIKATAADYRGFTMNLSTNK